uniref:Uncharacterized protein n=1 Tax=viral metagenome TaxID=1070528 RepID=A0A6C0EN42_9ZZZZ
MCGLVNTWTKVNYGAQDFLSGTGIVSALNKKLYYIGYFKCQ